MRLEEQCLGVLSGSATVENSQHACEHTVSSNTQPAWSVLEW